MNSPFVHFELLEKAFLEDIPSGDVTSSSIFTGQEKVTAQLKAKEDLVLSGRDLFEECFQWQHKDIAFNWFFNDSQFVLDRQVICQIQGPALEILKAERVGLNFLGRLSGIATLTRCFVEKVSGTDTKILDTRKTTPGLRDLEKKAVRDGGGTNHRMNLSDAVLIKDNHIRAAKGISSAVERVRKRTDLKIEVECSTIDEVKEAVGLRVGRIMLDNMSNEMMKEALNIIPGFIETEASGNMDLERVESVARLGVNFISVGLITHSAPCADMSLIFDWESLK